jgi:hypothetical protein
MSVCRHLGRPSGETRVARRFAFAISLESKHSVNSSGLLSTWRQDANRIELVPRLLNWVNDKHPKLLGKVRGFSSARKIGSVTIIMVADSKSSCQNAQKSMKQLTFGRRPPGGAAPKVVGSKT